MSAIPKVVAFAAVSVDGSIDGFPVDMGQFYGVAEKVPAEAILAGSGTLLAMEGQLPEVGDWSVSSTGPLLVAVDTQGRFTGLHRLRGMPYWRDVACVTSSPTPEEFRGYLQGWDIEEIRTEVEKADLRRSLEILYDRGVRHVRVESGGILNSILLRDALVSELWLMVHPFISPPGGRKAIRPELVGRSLRVALLSSRRMRGGVVLTRYAVIAAPAPSAHPDPASG
jgi:2,5-diamino-6-(ribosylamino)-4(3H)-pyrimidinone 5'-phosphate reductase